MSVRSRSFLLYWYLYPVLWCTNSPYD